MTTGGARAIIVPGLSAPFLGGLRHTLETIDANIAKLPGLIHDVHVPATGIDGRAALGRNDVWYDRRGGAPITYSDANVVWTASGGAGWGNRPTLTFSGKAGMLRMFPRSFPKSFTVLMAASNTSALVTDTISTLVATNGRFASPTGVDMYLRWEKPNAGDTTNMGMYFSPQSATGGILGPVTGHNTGASAFPRLWMLTYKAGVPRTSKIYTHTGSMAPLGGGTKTDHTADGLAVAGGFWSFMGANFPVDAAGMPGTFGRALIFGDDLTSGDSVMSAAFSSARALLMQYFGQS